jgi:phospholipid/cholesterol/gamma-HCH transport system permease protein
VSDGTQMPTEEGQTALPVALAVEEDRRVARGELTSAPRRGTPVLDDAVVRLPGNDRLQSAGELGALGVSVIRQMFAPPYPWWKDATVEFSLAIRRCIVPLVVSMITFAIGIAVLFVGAIVATLGTSDRLAGALVIGFTREPAVWVTSMVFAGVAGSAMTADIGARRIRDELDALAVLGVDTVRSLVVPRVVGMALVAPVLGFACLATALTVDYLLIPLFYPSVSYAGETEAMKSFLYSIDILVFCIKLPLVGAYVGLVACYKGLSTKGGAEGVGKAVNQAVVIMFLGLWLLNTILNSAYLAAFPSVQGLRG